MSLCNVLELQQSVQASQAGRAPAGCWRLAPGQALSLRPRVHGVLEVARGRAWVTLGGPGSTGPHPGADHVLQDGEQLAVAPGQHIVLEAWSRAGRADAVAFRWDVAAIAATVARAENPVARDWECGVVQPLRELAQALGHGGRALGAALADVARAGGRLAVSLARFALHRLTPPRQRKPA